MFYPAYTGTSASIQYKLLGRFWFNERYHGFSVLTNVSLPLLIFSHKFDITFCFVCAFCITVNPYVVIANVSLSFSFLHSPFFSLFINSTHRHLHFYICLSLLFCLLLTHSLFFRTLSLFMFSNIFQTLSFFFYFSILL